VWGGGGGGGGEAVCQTRVADFIGQLSGRKMYILDKEINFLRPTIWKLLSQMQRNSINVCDF
jgi:hypothetical protein